MRERERERERESERAWGETFTEKHYVKIFSVVLRRKDEKLGSLSLRIQPKQK